MSFLRSDDMHIKAFAMIVDINGFTQMVGLSGGDSIAQFVRDVLCGSISAIESSGGEVVGFMGDAVLGLLPTSAATVEACFSIAKDLNRQCEYISSSQSECPSCWGFAPGGPSLKIGIEYGLIDVSDISSRALGSHKLYIGDAINYAARILTAGSGNRCLIGPGAANGGFSQYSLSGPMYVDGKAGEPRYEYFQMGLSDVWIEGDSSGESYW